MHKKWVHVIGICGVTTSGVAVMFKNLGWQVTGSDKGFFPPVSDFLKAHKIKILPGFKLERLHEQRRVPDLVVIQGTKGDKNEEYQEALRLNIPVKPYAEVLQEYVVAPESIVIAGSFAKTTTTSMLVNIFSAAKIKISYMYGGLRPNNSPNVVARMFDTRYSIIEGDEYLTSFKDKRSKFFHYSPKYLLLTGLEYDHADLFHSSAAYLENFKELVATIPKDGTIFANIDDQNIQKILPAAKCKIVTFSSNQNLLLKPDWYLLRESRPLPTIIKNIKSRQDNLVIIPFERKIIGSFNDANMLAAAVVAAELGIKQTAIMAGLSTYDGIQRRLQIRARHDEALVIDDFGSTPAKAAACLATVRQEFPKHYLVPIFEPNAGNRGARTLELFKQVFNNADLVILPKFTLLPKATELRFSENDLWELLNEAGVKTEYFPIDADVISEIKQLLAKKKKIIIIFIGSHSFRGMIPKVCEALLNVKGKKTTKVK